MSVTDNSLLFVSCRTWRRPAGFPGLGNTGQRKASGCRRLDRKKKRLWRIKDLICEPQSEWGQGNIPKARNPGMEPWGQGWTCSGSEVPAGVVLSARSRKGCLQEAPSPRQVLCPCVHKLLPPLLPQSSFPSLRSLFRRSRYWLSSVSPLFPSISAKIFAQ